MTNRDGISILFKHITLAMAAAAEEYLTTKTPRADAAPLEGSEGGPTTPGVAPEPAENRESDRGPRKGEAATRQLVLEILVACNVERSPTRDGLAAAAALIDDFVKAQLR